MKTNKEIVIVVQKGLIENVYCSDKNFNVSIIDLDESSPELLQQLKAKAEQTSEQLEEIF